MPCAKKWLGYVRLLLPLMEILSRYSTPVCDMSRTLCEDALASNTREFHTVYLKRVNLNSHSPRALLACNLRLSITVVEKLFLSIS